MRRFLLIGGWATFVAIANVSALAQPTDPSTVIARVHNLMEEVRAASYPELKDAEIRIELFDSASDYFQTRFTFTSFLFQSKLRYLLKVNRHLFDHPASEEALRAILAHEIEHIVYYKARHRLQLLSLGRLASQNFTVNFERGTDLLAITHGYGAGLKAYREWLYQHIPTAKIAEKRRAYFSPEEIEVLVPRMQTQPELVKQWRKHPPRSLLEIEQNR